MFIFEVLALLLELLALIRPEILLSILGFSVLERTARVADDYTLVFMIASSMASVNMGVYYVLAALNDVKQFYKWTVPFRCVTFTVFTIAVLSGLAPTRFLAVGAWELSAPSQPVLRSGRTTTKQEDTMRSTWIEHNGKKIFYQDFSKHFYNSAAVERN